MAAQYGRVDFSKLAFLIIEDFDAMRAILRDLLLRCGARSVETAASGAEAINLLRRNGCDVVLCDYNLGPGKNGQQVLEEARHGGLVTAATIWIMVTAEKTHEMIMGAAEHQPDDYLLKPISESSLRSRMEKLIARKTALSGIAAAMRAKDYNLALELGKARLEQEPGETMEMLRLKASIHQLMGQPGKARALFEAVLARRDAAWARVGLAKLDIDAGKHDAARDALEQLIGSNSNFLEAYDVLAQVYQRQGAWSDARRILSQAVRLSPNSFQRQTALGESALRCEDMEGAEAAYQKALRLSEQTALKVPAAYLGLARVYTAKKKSSEALKVLSRLTGDISGEAARLQAKAEEVRVHHASGNVAWAAAAAAEVTAAIQCGSENLPAATAMDLAETLMAMGSCDLASELLQFVVRNNHEDEVLAGRAVELYDKAGMGAQGAALVNATRQQTLESMNRGVWLASHGQLDEALEFISQAKALMPRNPRLLLNHAYVLIALLQKNGWQPDMDDEARRSISTAREIVPGERRCADLLAKLDSLLLL
jgi:CheY-like chemotaxis protein